MRRSRPIVLCRLVVLAWLAASCSPADTAPLPDYVPDPEVYAAAPDEGRIADVPGHPGVQAPTDLVVLLLDEGEPRGSAERLAEAVDAEIVGQIPELGHYQLRLATTTPAAQDAAIASLEADPAVAVAGRDLVLRFRDCPAPSDVGELEGEAACPWTDSGYAALLDIFEERGGDIPGVGITVALIDTGLAVSNGEFDDVRVANVHAVAGATSGMSDPAGHGTQVAGVIAADDGDGGVNGIASRLLGPKLTVVWGLHPVSGPPQAVATQSLVATRLAIDAGARVVNYSFGFGRFGPTPTGRQIAVQAAYRRLMRQHPDVLFVAGAANEDWELTTANDAPAGLPEPNLLTVGSSMPCDPQTRVGPSARGPLIDLVAQGERISLVHPTTGQPAVVDSGTSFATPQVVAAAAIIRSIEPTLTAPAVRDLLLGHAALGPETTSGRALDMARPVLQLLLDSGNVLSSDIDPDERGVADDPGLVAARVCGGSSFTVRGLPTASFSGTSRPEDGVLAMGFLGADGFGIALQKPGPTLLSLACEGCDWDLGTFAITDDPADGVAGAFSLGLDVGGETLSGTWTFDRCVVESRYPALLSPDEGPQTVLIESMATGVMAVTTPSVDDDPRPFDAVLDAPFTVEPLDADDPLIVAIERACENGRR